LIGAEAAKQRKNHKKQALQAKPASALNAFDQKRFSVPKSQIKLLNQNESINMDESYQSNEP